MKNKLISKKEKNKSKNKKGNFLSKITFSLLVISTLSLFYFVVLVSTKPKSIPYITNKVEKVLKEKFSDNVKVENILFSFTKYGTMKLVASNVMIFGDLSKNYQTNVNQNSNQALVLPRIEAEFSILKMIFFQFQPKKIRVIDSQIKIDINDLNSSPQSKNDKLNDEISQLSALTNFLDLLKKGEILIEKFELQNSKIILKDHDIKNEIFIKLGKIKFNNNSTNSNDINIESQSVVLINQSDEAITLKSECVFSKNNILNCDINFNNLRPEDLVKFSIKLNDFDKIYSNFDGNIKIKVEDKKLKNFEFKISSDKGSFFIPKFISKKIDFKDLKILGSYDHEISVINFNEIEGDFTGDENLELGFSDPHFSMSMVITDLKNDYLKMDFYIRLQNILQNQLDKYWPINLNQNNIRSWVTNHINDGIIKNAYAKFSIVNNINKTDLIDIDSEIVFSDVNLSYDDYFPKLTNLSGIAKFSKKNMEIKIAKGDLLESKINNAEIIIDNFKSPEVILSISGDLDGNGSDGLKHVNYKSLEYVEKLNKYLGSDAKTKFKLLIPLVENISLNSIKIDVESVLNNLNNEFIKGDIAIKTFKNINSNNFITSINLNDAKYNVDDLDIKKENGIESELNFNLLVNENQNILFKDVKFSKNQKNNLENKTNPIDNQKISQITGEFDFNINPLVVNSIKINNKNFGENNYNFLYKFDQSKQSKKISLNGSKFFAGNILQGNILNNLSKSNSDQTLKNIAVNINLNRIDLINKKFLRNLNIFANCYFEVCSSLSINANYGKLQVINIQANKKANENTALIDGRITDIGYLAEGFGISNIISEGNAKITIQQKKIDKKNIVEGLILIDDDIVIFEDEKVKKLSKNTLYSQIKDSIFSSNKTTFDNVKIDFLLVDKILKINSLIANNFKIGITAKGEINLANNDIYLKGMIIPGYVVNNLFGIGKIPLIGSVISGVLTGGEGGGVFGLKYEYVKKPNQTEGNFTTNKVSAFVPSTIQNLFD